MTIRPHPALVLSAILLPTAVVWLSFGVLGDTRWPWLTYLFGTALQLSLPAWVAHRYRTRRRFGRSRVQIGAGLASGLALGLVLAAGVTLLCRSVEPGSDPLALGDFLQRLGVTTSTRFLLVGGWFCLAHAILEEVYWRWFVFGGLWVHARWLPAALLAALGYVLPVACLTGYLSPQQPWIRILPISAALGAIAILWAWLYRRHQSLAGPWVSHLLLNAALLACAHRSIFGG